MFNTKKFSIREIDNYYTKIIENFRNIFKNYGFEEHKSYPILSDIDNSVRFIGSTTNVFKPYIIKGQIPKDGYFLVQKCLRTRNLNSFFIDNLYPEWSSYFTAVGAICLPSQINKIRDASIEFLHSLPTVKKRLGIKINSSDQDLIRIIVKYNNKIKFIINSEKLSYYRHKYGLKNISGRNFNFVIENRKTRLFKDIGTIIIIEKDKKPITGEVGFGIGTLLSNIFDLENSVQAMNISKIIPFKKGCVSKLSDALSVVVIMLREKIQPGSRDKQRLLRNHLIALDYLRKKLELEADDVADIASEYEIEEFQDSSGIGDKLFSYLSKSENQYHCYNKSLKQ